MTETPKNVVLVGFMGTGKTKVGRALAARLGWEFVDTDELIARKAGKSVGEIFDGEGESGFRRLETEVIAALAADGRTGRVVATGGGIVTRAENWEHLRALGPVICLTATVDTIVARVSDDSVRRPILESADVREVVWEKLTERAAAYAKAGAHVLTDRKSPEEVAEIVIRKTGLSS